jgi:CheY-like chemotaxis protein
MPRFAVPAQSASLLVLVVEDEPDTRQSYATLLDCWGHKTVAAPDGVAALRFVEQQAPDVILLDLGLPRMSGLEVAKVIRGRWPCKPPVLIAVTGFGMTEDRQRSCDAGIDFHLLKPVQPDDLRCILEHCRPRSG